MASGESKGSHRYDKENLLWQSTVAIESDPVGIWKVETYIAFETLAKAQAFERYLKSGSGHAFAARHF